MAAPVTSRPRRRLLLGCLGLVLLPTVLFGLGFALSAGLRRATFIMMLAAPSVWARAWAADNLQHYPSDATVAALVVVVNRVNFEKEEAVAHAALYSLCVLTDHDFDGWYRKTSVSTEFGWPPKKPWREVVADVNLWAAGRTAETAAPAITGPPAAGAAAVQPLIDRIAGNDGDAASGAWTELGSQYSSASAYLADVRGALGDPRPIRFRFALATFAQAGQPTFRYFSPIPHSRPETPTPVRAATVGQALRLHLWAYEDVSNSGFQGTFEEWWAGYAKTHGLPVD